MNVVVQLIWKANAEGVEGEICEVLRIESLPDYFAEPGRFFSDHLQQYSKSRRQAPIYWPLSTPSCSYTLWLYYHRLTDQTLYTCINDFLDPKIRQLVDQSNGLLRKAERSAADEGELERLTEFQRELTDFRDELLRIARFWKPNLNDGVQITAAPLWRLFQHRPWQRKLKETWAKLETGDYDWAHLAMSIWPARVVPKCVSDRSLAIAHDLEDLFWIEDAGRWRNLNEPDGEIEEQKRRRRSNARDGLRGALQVLAAEKCWSDAALAKKLNVTVPARRTKATREKFAQQLLTAGCPDLAEALAQAMQSTDQTIEQFWQELDAGHHDHQPLALALWPDRVVDKCTEDVELAQTHGIQRFFWIQHPTETWRRRLPVEQEVQDEVQRRSRQ